MSGPEVAKVNEADTAKEITFPVPWGLIAAKAWGDPCASPALMLHGIQDNAGTFDRLLPYLPRGFYYLAIDLPGHGLSSRLPKGARLDFMQYVLSVNRVVRQLKWGRFHLIGHSLGGQLGQYYAALFPEQVTKLIVLDAYGPMSVPMEDYLSYTRKMHEEIMKLEAKILDAEPPSYTYEIALQRMMGSRRTPITREAAEKLVPRNLKPGKNGYYFSPDQRLKLAVSLAVTTQQHNLNYRKINCPFLLVLTQYLHDFIGVSQPDRVEQSYLGVFKENPQFELKLVDGDHDVHNISPEIIGPLVSEFLLRQKSSL